MPKSAKQCTKKPAGHTFLGEFSFHMLMLKFLDAIAANRYTLKEVGRNHYLW
jgi:hypothetical protein